MKNETVRPMTDGQKEDLVNRQLEAWRKIYHDHFGIELGSVVIPAHRKGFDLLDLHGAVRINGKLRNPQIGLGRVFPLPTPVIGTAKDVPCAGLTEQLLAAP